MIWSYSVLKGLITVTISDQEWLKYHMSLDMNLKLWTKYGKNSVLVIKLWYVVVFLATQPYEHKEEDEDQTPPLNEEVRLIRIRLSSGHEPMTCKFTSFVY